MVVCASSLRCFALWVIVELCMTSSTSAQNLTDLDISVVDQRLAEGAKHSWEFGTRAEVIVEYNGPSYSVLSSSAVQEVPADLIASLSDVFAIAHAIVSNRSISNGNVTGPQPLINDTSAGDPASIGFAVLLANWTGQGVSDRLNYAGAARDQLDYLFQKVPKTQDGAISHRVDQVQLWSDSMYMVPPFLAYYGATTQNMSLLQEAHNQIRLYRGYLRDAGAHGLWKHIQLGSYGTDDGHWSTGNGWAAAGMIRVLGTMQRSQYADSLKDEQADLVDWIREIHGGMYRCQDASSGLFRNYADNGSTFLDAASTALVASTVYRLSVLSGVHTHLPQAELARKRLSLSDASGMVHFTENGWLKPVVNPYAYPYPGRESPEGQAFVIAMQAAWRDWAAQGARGANAAVRSTVGVLVNGYAILATCVVLNVVLWSGV